MNSNFFKIDRDSQFTKNMVIFRYLPVHLKSDISNASKISHYYPIYLVVKKYAIEFYYHGPVPERKNNKYSSENDASEAGLRFNDSHVCILHLPLSLNLAVKDNLSSLLHKYFEGYYEIHPNYTIEIDEKSNVNIMYWNLPQYGNYSKFITDDENRVIVPFRKLILDFLFDLEHSEIFKASPFYEEMEVHLRENFVFRAIAAKCAYYYNRIKYVSLSHTPDTALIYAGNLKDRETDWLNIIRSEEAIDVFSRGKWFGTVEEEYKAVLFKSKHSQIEEKKWGKIFKRTEWLEELASRNEIEDKENIKIIKESARWFLKRYNILHAFRAIFQFQEKNLIELLIFPLIIVLFLLEKIPAIQNLGISDFLFGMVNFSVLVFPALFVSLIIVFWKMIFPLVGALLPRLIMAISSGWIAIVVTEELMKTSFDIQPGSNKLTFLLLIPIILFLGVEIKNLTRDINTFSVIKRSLGILLIGYFYAIFIGMFFIHANGDSILIRSGYPEEYVKNRYGNNLFPGYEIQDEFLKRIFIEEDSSLYKTAIRLAQLLQNEQIESTADSVSGNSNHESLPENIKILFNDIRNNVDEIQYRLLTFLTIKKTVRIFGANLNPKLAYAIPVYIPILKEQNPFILQIFPWFLMIKSIQVLFIGIFIQLIFEDKAVTEPL